jgi:glycosyltransferase involved in cell wall biosynthesis
MRNAQETLTRTVSKVLDIATELTPRCEVALIDDGSTDGTEEIACDLALRFPQVLVARHHQPRGVDEAIHTGVLATNGSIIVIVPPNVEVRAHEIRRLWRIGIGEDVARRSNVRDDTTIPQPSTVIARLMKWGQALKEESARNQNGIRMVRRELYRRRKSAKGFQPSRVDREASQPGAGAPNFITHVRDFALGE